MHEESTLAACTDGAYMSVLNIMTLSTIVGNPIQSVYPALNGEKDKTPGFLNKRFQTEENRNRHYQAFVEQTWTVQTTIMNT